MPYCPACGTPAADDAQVRYCAHCGGELAAEPPIPDRPPTAGPPPAGPPTVGPPPPYAPAGPSPAGQFARRVFLGPWRGPALAGAAPAAAVLAVAGLVGALSDSVLHEPSVGWWDRTRLALSALLQGVGPSWHGRTAVDVRVLDPVDGSVMNSVPDGGSALAVRASADVTRTAVTVLPLSVTLLWIAVLLLALRFVRTRQTGPEAAVRVALCGAAAALALALIAPVTIGQTRITPGVLAAASGALAIGLVTALIALPGAGRAAWLAARPQVVAVLRILRTALLALLSSVVLCGVIVLVVAAAYYDDITGWGIVGAALLLPNLGAAGLGVGWGGPLDIDTSAYSGGDSRDFHRAVDLAALSHVWGGWATVLAVAAGVVCALVIGLLAAWYAADRIEQFLMAGVYTVLFVVLVAVGGAHYSSAYGGSMMDGSGNRTSVGGGVAEALLFCLMWSFAGVAVGPYLRRLLGGGTEPRSAHGLGSYGADRFNHFYGVPPVPPAPPSAPPTVPPQAGPPAPGAPEPSTVHDLGLISPESSERPERRGRAARRERPPE